MGHNGRVEKAKILCTFSGRYGDILWSLPTVRELRLRLNQSIDFCCMPQYENLLPLIRQQFYVNKAFPLLPWICQGSPYGDQPWEAPVEHLGYEQVFHLTYRHHPQVECLADFIARQQHVALGDTWVPFLNINDVRFFDMLQEEKKRTPGFEIPNEFIKTPEVVVGFNPDHGNYKQEFFNQVIASVENKLGREVPWKDLKKYDWIKATYLVQNSKVFIGCRSALCVVAHGCGKPCVVFEPNVARHGIVFGCRVGNEKMFNFQTVNECVEYLFGLIGGAT